MHIKEVYFVIHTLMRLMFLTLWFYVVATEAIIIQSGEHKYSYIMQSDDQPMFLSAYIFILFFYIHMYMYTITTKN